MKMLVAFGVLTILWVPMLAANVVLPSYFIGDAPRLEAIPVLENLPDEWSFEGFLTGRVFHRTWRYVFLEPTTKWIVAGDDGVWRMYFVARNDGFGPYVGEVYNFSFWPACLPPIDNRGLTLGMISCAIWACEWLLFDLIRWFS